MNNKEHQPNQLCQQPLEKLMALMESDNFSVVELDQLCREYPSCEKEIRAVYDLWNDLEEVKAPEPSPAMHAGFYGMLSDYENRAASKSGWRIRQWPGWLNFDNLFLRAALASVIFVLGVFAGTRWLQPASGPQTIVVVPEKTYDDLIDQNSTAERLQVIHQAKQATNPDERIIKALNEALLKDPNINVRLSAIEAMLHFADNPKVRENLILAIPHQTSPLVQVTLADAMIMLEEKRSIEEIQKLLDSDEVEVEVKLQLERTLEVLL